MPTASRERATMPKEPSLKERYESVTQRIDAAARRSGRKGADIALVAVTKFASIDEIRHLIELGHVDFGENRLQNLIQRHAQISEFLQRHRELGGKNDPVPKQIRWHMIGHMQRNKVRKVVELVRLIHSVDSLRLIEEIQAASARLTEPVEVLVQINVSGEKQKGGVAPAAVRHLVDQIDTMVTIRPRGLMCMAQLTADPQESRQTFQLCAEVFDDIRRSGAGGARFNILSMGMSNDFEVAIECGSNMVRVGTAIFGEKPPQPEDAAVD